MQRVPSGSNAYVFVSYCRDDRARLAPYLKDLKQSGFEVWLDEDSLEPGITWEAEVARAIQEAEYFVVFLSKNSDRNWRFQQREIDIAVQEAGAPGREKWLLPVRLDDYPVPSVLQPLHATDTFREGLWGRLVAKLQSRADGLREVKPKRPRSLPAGGRLIPLPTFFPSLSSAAKTTITVQQHMGLLVAMKHPQFLVSAADVHDLSRRKPAEARELSQLIVTARQQGQAVLLDSGNYEKYWKRLSKWNVKSFHEVLGHAPATLAFCFDDLQLKGDQKTRAQQIIDAALHDIEQAQFESMLPIVHADNPDDLPEICGLVAKRMQPLMLAVPERELGIGILDRARNVVKIRKALNQESLGCVLHLLGTGNPISILTFYLAGADSFDGLEWCQTVVDVESGRLHHLSHYDLFSHQSPFGKSDIGPAAKALAHNLWYMENLMKSLQSDDGLEQAEQTLSHMVSSENMDLIRLAVIR